MFAVRFWFPRTTAVFAFTWRAMQARRLAYALIAEPCEPEIDRARLRYRAALAEQIRRLLDDGVARREFLPLDTRLAASCVTGAFMEALAKAEGCAAGERLQSSSLATTVRQHDGKTEVLDGPYADTKEQLAGYFVVDVPSLDEAIAWAKRCPSSKYGSIEIRPMLAQPGSKR